MRQCQRQNRAYVALALFLAVLALDSAYIRPSWPERAPVPEAPMAQQAVPDSLPD